MLKRLIPLTKEICLNPRTMRIRVILIFFVHQIFIIQRTLLYFTLLYFTLLYFTLKSCEIYSVFLKKPSCRTKSSLLIESNWQIAQIRRIIIIGHLVCDYLFNSYMICIYFFGTSQPFVRISLMPMLASSYR